MWIRPHHEVQYDSEAKKTLRKKIKSVFKKKQKKKQGLFTDSARGCSKLTTLEAKKLQEILRPSWLIMWCDSSLGFYRAANLLQ